MMVESPEVERELLQMLKNIFDQRYYNNPNQTRRN